MSTIEEEVISYIAATGDLATVIDSGITPDHFLDPDTKNVFTTILAFRTDFGEAPTADVILRDHPNFTFTEESSGPIEYLIRELHTERARLMVELGLGAAGDALEESGPQAALDVLRVVQTQATLATATSQEIDFAKTGPQRLEVYRQARENPSQLLGIPTGFRFLDRITQGHQRGRVLGLTGLAKSYKTTVMLGMARTAFEFGAKPIVLSFEMPHQEIARRLDGFTVQINPQDLLTGQTSDRDWRRLERALLADQGEKSLILTEDRAGSMTLSGIQAKIDKIGPDIVFLDGAYFLFDEITRESNTPLALTNISHGLKSLALNNDLPVVYTTQSLPHKLGKDGLGPYSLGYTSAWAMDADFLIGLEPTEDESASRMKLLIARHAPFPQETLLAVHYDPPRFEEAPEETAYALPY
ncbi:DnaB-like helicase C-terminal domain-containing protein [Kitasatospora sp. NPDC052896]|uniref:DnaB-like helicase C-terminal domain-containing protein n=1 Tax=Kitasatospora sp. NPDC052896 TaxID=3364061 RepID=UPI0037CA2CFF